jgi:alcohol dehydrogenase (cytochrome c)
MRKLCLGASLAALMMASALGVAYAADYTPVTDARLANPEPQNWLMTRGNYAGWSYSPLEQVNVSNVKNLVPVWSVSTGVDSGHEAPPIVNNGVMFVATPYSQVLALDAATGGDDTVSTSCGERQRYARGDRFRPPRWLSHSTTAPDGH